MPKTDWNKAYGPDADAYPVEFGDVWECGTALMACLDLETPALEYFYKGVEAKMAFVDPPWGKGNARSFRTKAGVDGEQGNAVDFDKLIDRVMLVLGRAEIIWMEMGKQSMEMIGEAFIERDYNFQVFDMKYYNRHPCKLFRAVKPPTKGLVDFPQNLDETPATIAAIEADSDVSDVILDPCMGRGLIPLESLRRGRNFIGSELSPRRMSVTLAKLERIDGFQPVKVDEIKER